MAVSFMSFSTALNGLKKISELISSVKDGKPDITQLKMVESRGSIIRFLSNMMIEPVIIVPKNLRESDATESVIEANIEIFTAYYTQAFHVITSLYGLEPAVAFDILSSKKEGLKFGVGSESAVTDAVISGKAKFLPLSTEAAEYVEFGPAKESFAGDLEDYQAAYDKYLEDVANYKTELSIVETRMKNAKRDRDAAERSVGKGSTLYLTYDAEWQDSKEKYKEVLAKGETLKSVKSALDAQKAVLDGRKSEMETKTTVRAKKASDTGLSTMIQKEVDITVRVTGGDKGSYEIIIPVFIKANVVYTEFDNILNMVDVNDREANLGNRFDAYRSGAISLKDLIFAGDLVKSYKEKLFKDKDGLIDYMNKRSEKSNKELLRHGALGFARYYSMLVLTKNQLTTIEARVGGKIGKPRYKERILEQSKSMMVTIMDEDYERVSIYTKDLNGVTDVSYRQIAKQTKGGGNGDKYADIFKDVIMGRTPNY